MKLNTIKAPSVEEAVRTAISKYNAYEDELNIKVVEKGSKGFLGFFGGKEAVIEVQLLPSYFERKIGEYLEGILKHFDKDIIYDIAIERKTIFVNIKGIEVSRLIGRHGKTVSAFQHIIGIYANRLSDVKLNVSVDVGNYKEERRQNVESLAHKMAKLAIQKRSKVYRKVVIEFDSRRTNTYKNHGRRWTNGRQSKQNSHRKSPRSNTSKI